MKRKKNKNKSSRNHSMWQYNISSYTPTNFDEEDEDVLDIEDFIDSIAGMCACTAADTTMETYCAIFEVLKTELNISDKDLQMVYEKSSYLSCNDKRFNDIYENEDVSTFDYFCDYLKNNFNVDVEQATENNEEGN